jgi:hypothetical protein
MKKRYLALLAASCVAANAANVNYDLLGRKGSKMNSPMVYKNVDYSKVKKNEEQKVGSSLENTSLKKTGMRDGYLAIEGATTTHSGEYFLKLFTSSEIPENHDHGSWNSYKNYLNSAFIETRKDGNTTPNYVSSVPGSNVNSAVYSYSDAVTWNDNHLKESPYEPGQIIQYTDYYDVRNKLEEFVYEWHLDDKSDVGIYIDVETPPVNLMNNEPVKYVEYGSGPYSNVPGYEMAATRTYQLLKKASINYNTVVYAGKGMPDNPAGQNPQVYIGVHNNKMPRGVARGYSATARDIDNYIYNNRTIEFVSAGDYGFHTEGKPKMDPQAFSVNAITVGAFDPIGEEALTYSSTARSALGGYTGPRKPEVYNFSNFYTYEFTRTYTKNTSQTSVYWPLYDGSGMATAYTAGMVANLLAINPFYRWHPEVVKALLLTNDRKTPTYDYLVFDDKGSYRYDFESRYWNGDINKLKTRTNSSGQHEIWFVVDGQSFGAWGFPAKAAISWLSSGDDVMNIGKVPQNFDLYVYGTDNEKYKPFTSSLYAVRDNVSNFDFNLGRPLASSTHPYNSFEIVSINSDSKYLVFKIVLKDEDSRSANKGQIVLGFNISPEGKYN